jgi:hypothetical protein
LNFKRIASRTATALAVAVSLVIGGAAAPAAFERLQPVTVVQPATSIPTVFGGCIRLYETGPVWHVDADHHTVGIDYTIPPEIDAQGFLTFHTLEKNPIISSSVQVDESLAARSIRTGGVSNGTYLVRIRLFKAPVGGGEDVPLDLNNPVHWSRVAGPYNNLWVTLVHDVPIDPA